MGRRIVGFLVGVLISATVFSVFAIVVSKDRMAPRPDAQVPPPSIGEPAPQTVQESTPPEPVVETPVEKAVPEVAEPLEPPAEKEPVVAAEPEPVEPPAEDAPLVVAEPAPQPVPMAVEPSLPELTEANDPAPLQKPEVLTEAPPAPQPVAPVPNPPLEVAKSDPAPEPVSTPDSTPVEPAPEAAPAEQEPEPQPEVMAEAEPAPVIRRSRLPVVTDDTERSSGIRIGLPNNSKLPSVDGGEEAAEPAIPSPPKIASAPPPTSAKRLAAPKTLRPEQDGAAILTPESEAPAVASAKPRAIDEFGVLFAPGDKPTMSIILVDVGNAGVTLNAAAKLALPVTFAVPVDRPDATLAANRYFESGHEVLALSPRSVELSLSGGQSQEQVANLVTEFFRIIPQSVGLLDVPEATLQNDRVLSNHVLTALHETGHGLVTYEEGLNVVKREADKAEVPAGLIYRAIDQKGENVEAIGRHLDRAVAEASRSGHVLVIGSTKSDTIDALEAWAKSRAARNVALAPVSASIK